MFKVYAITDVGKERKQNQDGLFIDGAWCVNTEHQEMYHETDSQSVNIALCDGVGSTKYAVDAVEYTMKYMASHKPGDSESEIEKYVLELNAYVYDSLKKEGKEDGACTLVGVISTAGDSYVYNIGDSPAYVINNGYLEKQSIDDTGASLFGDDSMELEEESFSKPPLLQSIGTYQLLDKIHIKRISSASDFLICSDGISDLLSIDEMECILEESNSLKELAQRYIEEANNKGGYDNSSIILFINEEE